MKRPTWILLLILLALVGLLVYLNHERNLTTMAESTPVEPVEFLLADTDGPPISISITDSQGKTVMIVRADSGSWIVDKPINAEAEQGAAEAAASQLTSLRVLSKPDVPPEAVGLSPASYTLSLRFTSDKEKTVRIGDLTPTESGYYASINGNTGVVILDKTGVEALLDLLQSPPYLLTPTASATASMTPTVEQASTPMLSETVTPKP
jgi:hypothetical protein